MIGISTLIYDAGGDLILWETADTRINESEARVARVATLDGGCVIVHQGISDSDRTMEITANLTEAEAIRMRGIYRDHTYVLVATRFGAFRGVISRYANNEGDAVLTILIKEKYTA